MNGMSMGKIPVVIMRGGTSRGLYFHAGHLPADVATQDGILAAALGSPDPYGRQINGLGGGTSSTSKAILVARDDSEQADIAYTFAQVDVYSGVVDRRGNCGNLTAGVGPFALSENLVAADEAEMRTVRLLNTNTGKRIDAHIPLSNGFVQEKGSYPLHGIPGTGAPIQLDFLQPGGAVTGKLLPTGKAQEMLSLPGGRRVAVTVVDATGPVVFVRAADFGLTGMELPHEIDARPELLRCLETIRGVIATRLGMVPAPERAAVESAAYPKVAMIAAPDDYVATNSLKVRAEVYQLAIRMVSMGRAHHSVPLTGALCTAVAATIPGTLANEAATGQNLEDGVLTMGHAAGTISAGAIVKTVAGGGWYAEKASVTRTARRLMEGYLYL